MFVLYAVMGIFLWHDFELGLIVIPISTGIFLNAYVLWGRGGSVGLPLNMAFLLQSCKNFGPQKKFMYLINFNWYLTFFCNLTLKLTLGPKLLLYLLYVPQKKAKIIKKPFLNKKIMICFRKNHKKMIF